MIQETYVALNTRFLTDADRLLEQGDSPQASEKYWGAAAEMVKAIAEARHWHQPNHRDLRGTISRLHRDSADGELLTLFSEAESLHAIFYEDFMEPEDVRYYADRIKLLVGKLRSYLN